MFGGGGGIDGAGKERRLWIWWVAKEATCHLDGKDERVCFVAREETWYVLKLVGSLAVDRWLLGVMDIEDAVAVGPPEIELAMGRDV
jgi:hypothetical protein